MKTKINILKKLLTTASILAVTAETTIAAQLKTAYEIDTRLSATENINVSDLNGTESQSWNDADDFKYTHKSDVTIESDGLTIGIIDLNNINGNNLIIDANNVNINSIIDNDDEETIDVIINEGGSLNFTGSEITAVDDLVLNKNSVVNFNADSTNFKGIINATTDNHGTVNINNNSIINGNLGNQHALGSVNIANSAATFSTATIYNAKETNFTNSNSKIEFLQAATSTTNYKTPITDNMVQIHFAANHSVIGNIGEKEAPINRVHLTNGANLTLNGDNYINNLNVISDTNVNVNLNSGHYQIKSIDNANKVNLNVTSSNVSLQEIGSIYQPLRSIHFKGDTGSIVNVEKNLHATTINLGHQTFHPTNNISLNGRVIMENSTINLDKTLTLTKGADISGPNIINLMITDNGTLDAAQLIIQDNVMIANDASFTLNINDEHLIGTANDRAIDILNLPTSDLRINLSHVNKSNHWTYSTSQGRTTLKLGAYQEKPTLSFSDNIAIEVDDTNIKVLGDTIKRPSAGSSKIYKLIGKTVDESINIAKLALPATHKFTKWTISEDADGEHILIHTDNAATTLKKALDSKADAFDYENIDSLTNADNGDSNDFVESLATLNTEKTNEALTRLTKQTIITSSIQDSTTGGADIIGSRVVSVAGSRFMAINSSNVSGVAAGEESIEIGAWFSPFYNNTTQKERQNISGYKSTTTGVIFGFDAKFNDDLILGTAFTTSHSGIKHSDIKSGDITKIDTLLFSIYGLQQMTDKLYINGSITIGTNEVQKRAKRVDGNNYKIASSKYKSKSFSSDLMLGYHYITKQATITPMLGLRYSSTGKTHYKESGATSQNLDVSIKESRKLEAITGVRASTEPFELGSLRVAPEIHAFINHDMINKSPQQTVKLGNTILASKSYKPAATTYKIGVGTQIERNMMEYNINYDLQLAHKRIGHQGSLKIRVNF